MLTVGVRDLSHQTSRFLARVKAGQTLEVTEHGKVIAVITPATHPASPRPRPSVGGYRSKRPLTAEEIDAALGEGFGDSHRR